MILSSIVLLLVGLGLVAHTRQRELDLVGAPVEVALPGRGLRRITTGLLLALGVAAAFAPDPPRFGLLAVGLLVAALEARRPAFADRVCGTEGVRVGWSVRGFAQLEEWRLIGDHLRFKLRGEWNAVPLGADRQAPVRERLLAVAAERESAFDQ